jgi:hypothetical protein
MLQPVAPPQLPAAFPGAIFRQGCVTGTLEVMGSCDDRRLRKALATQLRHDPIVRVTWATGKTWTSRSSLCGRR